MFIFSVFAFRTTPFSLVRFFLYLAALAVLTAGSMGIGLKAPEPAADPVAAAPPETPPAKPRNDGVETVRLCMSADDLRADLTRVNIPWFPRRQGVVGKFQNRNETDVAIDVIFKGQSAGTYVERITALDEGRTMLEVGFVPGDVGVLAGLVKPIQTDRDPADLMRVVMAEHTRSALTLNRFDFGVLTKASDTSVKGRLGKAFIDAARGDNRNGGPMSCPEERHEANVRRAYREEAQKAGASANKL